MDKNPIDKFILFISLNSVKSLQRNKSTKSFIVSKDEVSQTTNILIDIVKIRSMSYCSNCLLKIKRHFLCVMILLCK